MSVNCFSVPIEQVYQIAQSLDLNTYRCSVALKAKVTKHLIKTMLDAICVFLEKNQES